MSLPSWATHLAVDEDGSVHAFDAEPVWTNGVWVPATRLGRCQYLEDDVSTRLGLSKLLCVRIPRPMNAP